MLLLENMLALPAALPTERKNTPTIKDNRDDS